MKFGHHGGNHPVREESDRSVAITSQNHGFAVDLESLGTGAGLTHLNLFDQTVAGLRLLAGCGDASALAAVGRHLDSSDNSIRIEAINACRGIVDGDPPLARLSAFEAIEVAKKWKGRL